MMRCIRTVTVLLTLVLATAVPGLAQAADSPLLDSLLRALPTFRQHLAASPDSFELQVLLRPLTGPDSGVTHRWGVDPRRYFYPASTVKLPAAILALQWLEEQGVVGLDADAVWRFARGRPEQIPSEPEGSAENARPLTVRNLVTDAMVVSDNEAYNRLFEITGARYLNDELHRRGWPTRIVHRVGVGGYDAEANTYLPPVSARAGNAARDTLYYRGLAVAKHDYEVGTSGEVKGVGRYDDALGRVVDEPFDFSAKNLVALEDLAGILQALVAPATVDSARRFRLGEAHRALLLRAISTRPRDSPNPAHHARDDGYVNFLYYGGGGAYEPDGPTIYNKVGDAYGYLTEAAVFEDAAGGRFLLAATVHVNANRVYNDGVYEYDEIGLPLLRELGRAVWASWRAGSFR